jgi:hypothetical protein
VLLTLAEAFGELLTQLVRLTATRGFFFCASRLRLYPLCASLALLVLVTPVTESLLRLAPPLPLHPLQLSKAAAHAAVKKQQ